MGTSWFSDAGLGIFIHWGHAAVRGWELSWQMVGGVEGQYPPRTPVSCDEYFANAATFDPVRFDAAEWAKAIVDSGARYVVFTAKHHDGFALWDTALSDYSVTKASPFGRDIVAELVPALRTAGLRMGLYFSIVDWYSEWYPRYTDSNIDKPYVVGRFPKAPSSWPIYRDFMLGQLTELLTRFGPIDIIWLDGQFEHTPAEWDFAGIRNHIRALQPDCLVNDRCLGYGDFSTPEQELPSEPPTAPWEQCATMNDSWSYVPADHAWKSPHELIEMLVETVCAGGNLLLGIGPTGEGTFPPEVTERLKSMGEWVRSHRRALEHLGRGLLPWQCRLPSARRSSPEGEQIFIYLTMDPGPILKVHGLPVRRINAVRLDETEVPFIVSPSIADIQARSPDPSGELTVTLPV